MRRAVLACGLVLLLAAAVWALPPTNQELFIQPDESFPWVCDFGVTIVGTPTLTLTYLQGGTGACPSSLVTGLQVNGGNTQQAIWTWTPSAPLEGKVCWLHVLATDTAGSKVACDGKVTIRKNKPTS